MSKFTIAVMLICFVPVVAVAKHVPIGPGPDALGANQPGAGTALESLLLAGTSESLFTIVKAGDVVFCDFGVICNSSTSTSDWSDVLVFYNSAKGPYVTDVAKDANTAGLFSSTDLNAFIERYDNHKLGHKGLSSDVVFLNEDASGNIKYGPYDFGGLADHITLTNTLLDGVVVPEPDTLIPIGIFLATLAFRRHYKGRQKPA